MGFCQGNDELAHSISCNGFVWRRSCDYDFLDVFDYYPSVFGIVDIAAAVTRHTENGTKASLTVVVTVTISRSLIEVLIMLAALSLE